jgi:hypothetical protein
MISYRPGLWAGGTLPSQGGVPFSYGPCPWPGPQPVLLHNHWGNPWPQGTQVGVHLILRKYRNNQIQIKLIIKRGKDVIFILYIHHVSKSRLLLVLPGRAPLQEREVNTQQ